MSEEDGDLVRRAARGDQHAFSRLVDRHYDASLRFATLQLGNREDAEDAVQDAFVRVHRSLHSYEHEGRFRAWLFRILVNRCRSFHQKRRRRQELLEGADLERGTYAAMPDPHAGEWRPEVERALASLPAEQREAFLLKYVEEWSYDQMTSFTGVGTSALKMRVARARDQLKRSLGGGL